MAVKILIAEDDIQLLEMYKMKFELEGFEVYSVEDGQRALEEIKNVNPDVVLLDLMMPIVDGFGVLKQIKQDPMLSNLIVIILTNLADEKTAEEIYKLGATEYLIKSELTPLEVAVRVKELISYYKKDQLKK